MNHKDRSESFAFSRLQNFASVISPKYAHSGSQTKNVKEISK